MNPEDAKQQTISDFVTMAEVAPQLPGEEVDPQEVRSLVDSVIDRYESYQSEEAEVENEPV